jgi:hypothetical protein
MPVTALLAAERMVRFLGIRQAGMLPTANVPPFLSFQQGVNVKGFLVALLETILGALVIIPIVLAVIHFLQ